MITAMFRSIPKESKETFFGRGGAGDRKGRRVFVQPCRTPEFRKTELPAPEGKRAWAYEQNGILGFCSFLFGCLSVQFYELVN